MGGGVPGKGLSEGPRDGGERVCLLPGPTLGKEEWRAECGVVQPSPTRSESVRHLQKRPWPERKGTREGIPASRGEGVARLAQLGCTLPRNAGRAPRPG